MKTKQLTFLLSLTFLFLFSGSSVVFCDDLKDAEDALKREDYETAMEIVEGTIMSILLEEDRLKDIPPPLSK